MAKGKLKVYETFDNDPDEYLRYCWISIAVHIDRDRALSFAVKGKEFLDNKSAEGLNETELKELEYRQGLGYHIVATAFIWNEWYGEAFKIEKYFIKKSSISSAYKEYIGHYLVILMIKDQQQHLEELFMDIDFKYSFLPWWETYMSLMVDDTTPIMRMEETVPIINQVNNGKRIYN